MTKPTRHQSPRPYVATPKRAPIPAVAAIAGAPQKVTRAMALPTGAPPVRAETPPSKARKPKDVQETTIGIRSVGDMKGVRSGAAAPSHQNTESKGYSGSCRLL